jgi:hypothetical protein
MTATRLPDCKPPRRDESITSSSSHPELLIGEIAMRPRVHVPLTPADRAVVSVWSRRMLAVYTALVVAGLIAHFLINQAGESVALEERSQQRALSPACMHWHEAAGDAVSRLARSTKDVDLRQLNDAIFRMRRARRNCAEGWFMLACQDYYAVARSLPGNANTRELVYACRPSAEWTNAGNSATSQP